jgi:hypothetical protein
MVYVQDSEIESPVIVKHVKDNATRSARKENWPTLIPKRGKQPCLAFKKMFLKCWKSWEELREASNPGRFLPVGAQHGE